MKNKSIIVTGGAGFLGQYIVENLKKNHPESEIHIPRSNEYDLKDREATLSYFERIKPTHVIHLAAPSGGVVLMKENPQKTFEDNLLMAMHVIEASAKVQAKQIIWAGTAAGYPAQAPLPYKESDFWNGYPDEMEASYGIAHKAALAYAKIFLRTHGLKTHYVILSNLYGPRARFDHTAHVIPSMIKKFEAAIMEKKPFVESWGTGKALREFLYVEDAAAALVSLLDKDSPEIFNFGSGEEVSIKHLAETVSNLMGYSGELRWDPTKPEGRLRRVLDSTLAHQQLGLKAPIRFEMGIRKTIEWYLSQKK